MPEAYVTPGYKTDLLTIDTDKTDRNARVRETHTQKEYSKQLYGASMNSFLHAYPKLREREKKKVKQSQVHVKNGLPLQQI